MATWRNICFTSVLLFFFLCHPGLCESDGDDGGGDGDRSLMVAAISKKYMMVWSSPNDKLGSSWSDFNDDIDSVLCTSDLNCTAALYNLDLALSYESPLPSKPYCVLQNTGDEGSNPEVGHCTCGAGRCVSYSRSYSLDNAVFYYCGPCGWVGAQCTNHSCTHALAECRGGYCECTNDGIFYDLTYCYIPFYFKSMAIEMLVSTAVIAMVCTIFAYGYHRFNARRQRGYPDSWFRSNTRREEGEGGKTNDAFEPDDIHLPPAYGDVNNGTTNSTSIAIPEPMSTLTPITTSTPISTSTHISTSTPMSTSKFTPASTSEKMDEPDGASAVSDVGERASVSQPVTRE
ncbi:hypothetical protein Hamer_G025173 [Homarus americanus]|uniref:EGF-like domain-containing protein n=1 Tax=Homarus americanus TaxID=6706 RepID=A0A8J5MVA8_HOMAM|nr:hypothetical protein Hamer_G025173 [Homarus americanus]